MASLLFAQCYVSKNNSHLKKGEMGLEKNSGSKQSLDAEEVYIQDGLETCKQTSLLIRFPILLLACEFSWHVCPSNGKPRPSLKKIIGISSMTVIQYNNYMFELQG